MTQFNILHISDLHISTIPMTEEIFFSPKELKKRYPEFLKRYFTGQMCASHNLKALSFLAKFIYQRKEMLDAIIITGDIATTGKVDDLNEAKYILSYEPYSNSDFNAPYIRPDESETPIINGNENIPIILLPGNHDRYEIENFVLTPMTPGGTNFFEIFRDFWKDEVVNSFTLEKENTALGVIAADFSLIDFKDATTPQYLTRWAEGKIYPHILEELISRSTQFIKESLEKDLTPILIWAVHFPPAFSYGKIIKSLSAYFTKSLLDEDKLIYHADYNHVSLIMAGHTHIPKFYSIPLFSFEQDDPLLVHCSGSTLQYYNSDELRREVNYCHILTLEHEEDVIYTSVKDYKLDDKRGFIRV